MTLPRATATSPASERVAQSVEHLTFNQRVPGSSPGALTTENKYFGIVCFHPWPVAAFGEHMGSRAACLAIPNFQRLCCRSFFTLLAAMSFATDGTRHKPDISQRRTVAALPFVCRKQSEIRTGARPTNPSISQRRSSRSNCRHHSSPSAGQRPTRTCPARSPMREQPRCLQRYH